MRLISEYTFVLDASDMPVVTRQTSGGSSIHDIGDDGGYSIRFRPCAAHIKVLRDCLRILEDGLAEKQAAIGEASDG